MGRKDLAGKKRFGKDFVSVTFNVRATDVLEHRGTLWEDFLGLIIEHSDFTPEMYDLYDEPPKEAFDRSDLSGPFEVLLVRAESPLFERYEPYYMFYDICTGHINPATPINWEGITAEGRYFENPDRVAKFIDFSKKLYRLFEPFCGFACHAADENAQNTIYTYSPPGHPRAGEVASEAGFGGDSRQGIPGVYWANFFSRIYVDTIGRYKFLTAPCHERQELDDGGFLLLTSESPLDWEKPQVQDLRKAMRDHLGYEYFCDIENQDKVCKVPPFDFSVWEKECDRGMKIPDRWKDLPTAKF